MTTKQFIKEVKAGTNDGYSLSAFEYCNIHFDSRAKADTARDLQQWQGWSGSECNHVIDALCYIDPECEYCLKHSKNNNSLAYDTACDILGDNTDCLLYGDMLEDLN